MSNTTNEINPQASHSEFDIRKYIKTFIEISSPLGILAMYACILSHEKSMPFHISLLSDSYNTMYCAGFLVATAATGIVNSTIDFNTGMINVVEYVDIAKEDIEKWLESHTLQSPLQDIRTKIDSYFSQQK